jgi:DNA-binding NarL/FixJ family response regulator
MIRVLIVDDHTLFRQGLKMILREEGDIRVVGEADSGEKAVEQAALLKPDLVLMDIMMPGSNGISATRSIRQNHPQSRVLVLTAHVDQELFRKVAEAGAAGYVEKDISPTNLIAAIRAVHEGGTSISPSIAKQMFDYFFATRSEAQAKISPAGLAHGLTEREIEVLSRLVEGLSDKEIGAKLFISESTVKTHLRAIYHRLHVRNRAQAVALAIERKLSTSV